MKEEEEKLSQIYLRYDRLRDKLVIVQYYGEEAMMSRVELRMTDAVAVVHAIQTMTKERLSLLDRETVNEEILKFIYRREGKGLPLQEYERRTAAALGVSDWVVSNWVEQILDDQPIPEILLQVINVQQVKNDLYYRELRPKKAAEIVGYDELTVDDFIALEKSNNDEDSQPGSLPEEEISGGRGEGSTGSELTKAVSDSDSVSGREGPSFYSSVLFD